MVPARASGRPEPCVAGSGVGDAILGWMKRVSVIGVSGSGKTTVARRLSSALDVPHLELDSLFHQPTWTPMPDAEFRRRVSDFVRGDSWVVDGNYASHGVAELVWAKADTIVWLDLPRSTVMRKVISRTIRRAATRETLWNGNKEPWSNFFDPRPEKNIIVWAWTHHSPVRERYSQMNATGTWGHARVERLGNQARVVAFLAGVAADHRL